MNKTFVADDLPPIILVDPAECGHIGIDVKDGCVQIWGMTSGLAGPILVPKGHSIVMTYTEYGIELRRVK